MILSKTFQLVIIYIIALLVTMWRNHIIIKDDSYYDKKNLVYSEIKTGDVFLVSFTRKKDIIEDTIMWANFKHPALAVWENKNLYMIEYCYHENLFQGLSKIPFDVWINIYKKSRIMKNSLTTSCEKREKLQKDILDYYYKNEELYNKFLGNFDYSWVRFFFPFLDKKSIKDKKNIVCHEVIKDILVKCDVIKSEKLFSIHPLDKFINMKGFNISRDYKFNENYICNSKHLIKKQLK